MSWADKSWVRHLLLTSVVVWLIIGAGLLSHLAELPEPLPHRLTSAAVVVDSRGRSWLWQEAPVEARFFQDRILRELRDVDAFFEAQVLVRSPIQLQLNFQSPDRYAISGNRVELGINVASSNGQIRHAIFKAWLLRNASPVFTASSFRQEVAADLLLAMSRNRLGLEVPSSDDSLEYGSGAVGFYENLATLGHLCRSNWRPISLARFCVLIGDSVAGAVEETSPYSLRRVIGEAGWRAYSTLGAGERRDYIRGWISYLAGQDPKVMEREPQMLPDRSSLKLWQAWARAEVDALVPSDVPGIKEIVADKFRRARSEAITTLGLDPQGEEPMRVDIVGHFDSAEAIGRFAANVFASTLAPGPTSPGLALASDPSGFRLLPGGVRIQADEIQGFKTRRQVWESCKVPTVRDLLAYPLPSERILVLDSCDGRLPFTSWRSFVRYGIEGFALDNPDRAFVLVHRRSLEFAESNHWTGDGRFLRSLLSTGKAAVDSRLGIDTAAKTEVYRAFRPRAAVDAIEWFRPHSQTPKGDGKASSSQYDTSTF